MVGVAPGPGEAELLSLVLGVSPDPPLLSPCDKSSLGSVSKEVCPRGSWCNAMAQELGGRGSASRQDCQERSPVSNGLSIYGGIPPMAGSPHGGIRVQGQQRS